MLFAGVFVLAAVLAYLAPLGLAPLVGVAGLLCIGIPRAPFPRQAVVGLCVLFLWAGASMLWSPARPWLKASSPVATVEHVVLLELSLLAVLACLAASGPLRLAPAQGRLAAVALLWSILALSAVLTAESLEGGRVYGALARLLQPDESADLVRIYTARGGYVLAVLMWPWLRVLSGRDRWLAPAPFLAVTAVSLLLPEAAPLAAVIAGSAAFVIAYFGGRRGASIVGALHAAFWLGAPWAVQLAKRVLDIDRLSATLKPSWAVRLDIWRFAADRIAEHPWRGWGMDASRAFEALPLHPHDSGLQVWLELVLPGAALVTALWLGLLRCSASRPDRIGRAAAAAGMSAYLTIGAVSFGLWQPWWLAVGVLAVLGWIVARQSGGA